MIPELGFAVAWICFICLMCLFEKKGDSPDTKTAKRIARYSVSYVLVCAVAMSLLALWIVKLNEIGAR